MFYLGDFFSVYLFRHYLHLALFSRINAIYIDLLTTYYTTIRNLTREKYKQLSQLLKLVSFVLGKNLRLKDGI